MSKLIKRSQVTAENVVQAILHRITTGQYREGDVLPSVRDLAKELGSNRNTVVKAYHTLLDVGTIESIPSGRRGFKVLGAPHANKQSKSELLNYFYQQAINLIWNGMAAGISAAEMDEQLTSAIDEVYRQSSVGLYFVECNQHDSEVMGHELEQALGVQVDCGLLDDLRGKVAETIARYDLLVTTFHHMADVLEMVRQAGAPTNQVVGIDTRPTPETMLGIARFPNRCIALVSTMSNTSHMLKHIIFSYHPDWCIEAATIDDPAEVKRIIETCDHLVVTHTCAEEVEKLTGRAADVVVNFQIDEQSILFLRNRIQEMRRSRMLRRSKMTTDRAIRSGTQP